MSRGLNTFASHCTYIFVILCLLLNCVFVYAPFVVYSWMSWTYAICTKQILCQMSNKVFIIYYHFQIIPTNVPTYSNLKKMQQLSFHTTQGSDELFTCKYGITMETLENCCKIWNTMKKNLKAFVTQCSIQCLQSEGYLMWMGFEWVFSMHLSIKLQFKKIELHYEWMSHESSILV